MAHHTPLIPFARGERYRSECSSSTAPTASASAPLPCKGGRCARIGIMIGMAAEVGVRIPGPIAHRSHPAGCSQGGCADAGTPDPALQTTTTTRTTTGWLSFCCDWIVGYSTAAAGDTGSLHSRVPTADRPSARWPPPSCCCGGGTRCGSSEWRYLPRACGGWIRRVAAEG